MVALSKSVATQQAVITSERDGASPLSVETGTILESGLTRQENTDSRGFRRMTAEFFAGRNKRLRFILQLASKNVGIADPSGDLRPRSPEASAVIRRNPLHSAFLRLSFPLP
jgi:hypothetical protein